MQDLWTAAALVLVIEGLLWAAFPEQMKRAVASVMLMEQMPLRLGGLAFAGIGVLLVWIVRG